METKTGFIASSFDILHSGYVMMLKECKDNCSYLVVGLHENPSWGRQNKNILMEGLSIAWYGSENIKKEKKSKRSPLKDSFLI